MIYPRLRSWLSIALLAAAMASAAADGTVIKTIQLQHRPAEELIPLVKAMVENSGGAVSGTGYTLVIRVRDDDIPQVTSMVHQLDTPLKQLQISLRQSRHVDQGSANREFSARAGGGISTGDGSIHADTSARVYSTRKRDQDATTQRIRVSEGRWANIETTLQLPVVEQIVDVTGGQERVLNAVKYKDLVTGFSVRATIDGDHAVIDIMPRKAGPDSEPGGSINAQTASTSVTGKVGEWLDIGGVVGNMVEHERGTISTGDRHREDERHILLRVDVL